VAEYQNIGKRLS